MSTDKLYTVNEVFWSPQGEGGRAGEMSLFVRFTGCNLRCRQEPGPRSPGGFDCDTEFASGRRHTLQGLVDLCVAELPEPARQLLRSGPPDCGPWIVFTGGEPGLQLDAPLCEALVAQGFKLAVETNGSIDLSGLPLHWVTVSPKVAEHAVRQLTASEVRYVRARGQGIPKPACQSALKYISPAFLGDEPDPEAIRWCLQLISENPQWRLSVQQHKLWRVR